MIPISHTQISTSTDSGSTNSLEDQLEQKEGKQIKRLLEEGSTKQTRKISFF